MDCDNPSADLLFLHGAGKADRTRFQGIRQALSRKCRVSSTAFDYLGHGESTGNRFSNSLQSRTEQACQVIEKEHQQKSLSIVASSMSAYTALKLTERYQVADLILFVPAVYHRDAYAVPFGPGFSRIIRRDSSWVNSDAWNILEAYTGNLLLIAAEDDQVIPKDLVRYLYDFAVKTNYRKIYVIPDAPHRILEFISGRPEYTGKIIHEMNILMHRG